MENHIYLAGFMGSGKSTVGLLLARQLHRPFYDLDDLIEKGQKMKIVEIFDSKGEPFFRKLESRLLTQGKKLPPSVIALGGGAFVRDSNREVMEKIGVTVWLKIPFEIARERCEEMTERPLARDPGQFESFFQLRQKLYCLANVHVETAQKTPQEICAEIQDKLKRRQHGDDGTFPAKTS